MCIYIFNNIQFLIYILYLIGNEICFKYKVLLKKKKKEGRIYLKYKNIKISKSFFDKKLL